MLSINNKFFFANLVFKVSEKVYAPAEDSFLFAENLKVMADDAVLDMGTGCGILGIIAAEKAASVVAIDLNPYAILCAKENAKLNRVTDKISFICGNLFMPLRKNKTFDIILFNAPYLPSDTINYDSTFDLAWAGGKNGRQVIDRFIYAAPRYLEKSGSIFLMHSSLASVKKTKKRFEENGLKANLLAKRDLPFFETLILIEAKC
jgi:release factor glutamine methyltransferase